MPELILLAFVLLLHGGYSVTPSLSPHLRESTFLLGSVLLAALLAAACLGWRSLPGAASGGPQAGVAQPSPTVIEAGMVLVMLVSAAYFSLPNHLALPLIAGFVAVQAVLLALGRPAAAIAVSAAVLLIGLVFATIYTQFDTHGADMMPVTRWANQTFLSGRNPYFEDYTAVTPGPFYYLPVEWLVYLPFEAMHLDPRLLNIAAVLGVFALYLAAWRDISRPWTGLAILLAITASRPSTEMVYQGVVWPLWFLTAAFALALLRRRLILTAILLGLLLADSQTALLPAALLAVWQVRSGAGWRQTLLLGLIVCAVYVVIVFPFARGVIAFIRHYYVDLPRLAGIMSEQNLHNATSQISLLNVITRLGLADLRSALQLAAGLAGMAVLAIRPRSSPKAFLAITALTYLGAIGLNTQVWKYYYIIGIILLFWSIYAPAPRGARVTGRAA